MEDFSGENEGEYVETHLHDRHEAHLERLEHGCERVGTADDGHGGDCNVRETISARTI